MKRIFPISCLAILLFNIAGFYPFFFINLSSYREHRQEEIKRLPIERLQKIVLTEEEYNTASVEEHEVRIQNRMYDVVHVIKHGKQLILYALHDQKEDNLLALLNHVLSIPFDKKNYPEQVFAFLSLDFLAPHITHFSHDHSGASKAEILYVEKPYYAFPGKVNPPPRRMSQPLPTVNGPFYRNG